MRILVLNPPFLPRYSRNSRSPAVTHGGTLYYPFWLAYATGVLEKDGFQVVLKDCPADGSTLEDVEAIVREFDPQLVVIDTSTPSIHSDVKVAAKLKGVNGCFTVLVGTHPSALPEETMNMSGEVDAIARKEYDYTIRELAHTLENKKDLKNVRGLTYRKDGKIMSNPDREPIHDMNELPFVSQVYKRHLDVKNYFWAAAEWPMVMIISARGCIHRCSFCVYPQVMWQYKFRPRSAENVVEEFEWIVNNMPEVKTIGVEDDTFTIDEERVKKICRMLIEKGINKKIHWWSNTRVNLGLETMKLMKEAGCRLMIAGYESGSQELLNGCSKGITVEQSIKFAENAKKAKILVHGCFIFGLPGETKETARQTIELAKKLNPDTAQFFPLMIYPGTRAYEWMKEHNAITTTDFTKWLDADGHHRTVINLPGLSTEEIVKWCDIARKEFYLRPSYIMYKAKQSLLNPSEAQRTFKSARTFFKNLFA